MMDFTDEYCDLELCNDPKKYRCELEKCSDEHSPKAYLVAGNKTIEVDGNSSSTMMPSNDAKTDVVFGSVASTTVLMFFMLLMPHGVMGGITYKNSYFKSKNPRKIQRKFIIYYLLIDI